MIYVYKNKSEQFTALVIIDDEVVKLAGDHCTTLRTLYKMYSDSEWPKEMKSSLVPNRNQYNLWEHSHTVPSNVPSNEMDNNYKNMTDCIMRHNYY